MKRKTILFAIAAMAFIAFSCAREEVPVSDKEIAGQEEVDTRAGNDGHHCYTCGFWTENGVCVGCDTQYTNCIVCGNYAPGNGSICNHCRGKGNDLVDWVPNPGNTDPNP